MFMLMCAGLLAASVPLTGGHLGRLAALRIRHAWLLVVALAAQVLIVNVLPSMNHVLAAVIHVTTYAAAGWVIYRNRAVPGLVVLAAGAAMNGVTIAVNGGTLPANPAALRAAGWTNHTGDFANSGAMAHAHLSWLGDNYVTPAALPLRNVFSLGDVVILLGAAILLHAVCETRLARLSALARRRGRPLPI
jgi:hypothetical protein